MTLRLSDEQAAALRATAEAEGRSMQSVALQAVDEYTSRAAVHALMDMILVERKDLMRRLGEA